MKQRKKYYSIRTGKRTETIDLPLLKELYFGIYSKLRRDGYFQEAFGYSCIDAGEVSGYLGEEPDINHYFLKTIRKKHLYPIGAFQELLDEEDMFDTIELLYDLVSYPEKGRYHDYGDCGWHYEEFDKPKGQKIYRDEVNDILLDYDTGYELSEDGEIMHYGEVGLRHLHDATIPEFDPDNVDSRVKSAVMKFRSFRSSIDERKSAIRDLADVFEYLRPKIKELKMTNDENDLFHIANNFSIRHHNQRQKDNYNKPIFLSWIFYIYLATIHLLIRLIQRGV